MFNVEAEHQSLSTAISNLHKKWKTPDLALAALDLLAAVEHAEQALIVLLPQAENRGTAFQVRVAGLRALTFLAYNELKRVKEIALKTLEQSMGKKKTESQLLDTVFKRGTILSCPKFEEGLYKN